MNILALIPSYNHGKYLPFVVEDVKKYCKDILIVDDGSTDNTSDILQKLKDVNYITHQENKGKGAALKTGFKYAIDNKYGAVITIDADGQHKAFDIPNFIKKIPEHSMIIGSRMHNVRNMPLRRILANSISSFGVSLKTGQKIYDSQSGFRMIRTDLLKDIKLDNDGYHLETEIIIKSIKQGYNIGHINIETIYGKETSHINPLKATFRFLKTLLQY
ncbi:MAG: glycosyltransferase family 2 protein [Nanoarchaeota archaeon]